MEVKINREIRNYTDYRKGRGCTAESCCCLKERLQAVAREIEEKRRKSI